MRLSDKEKAIIFATQFSANLPVPEIAKMLNARDHTVHYCLRSLTERGIIRRTVFVDMCLLGFTEHAVYFSLAAAGQKIKEQLMKTLAESKRVIWLAELGGNFQYALTVCAKNIKEVSTFLDSLTRKFGDIFFEKSTATIVTFSLFKKKYLCPDLGTSSVLSIGSTGRVVSLDCPASDGNEQNRYLKA